MGRVTLVSTHPGAQEREQNIPMNSRASKGSACQSISAVSEGAERNFVMKKSWSISCV